MRTSRSALVAVALFSIGALVVACGVRGPLDIETLGEGDEADSGSSDAKTKGKKDADVDTSQSDAAAEASIPSLDAGVDADAATPGPVQCGGCLLKSCGNDVVACLGDTDCRDAFQCVATQCLAGGGGLDLNCIGGCVTNTNVALQLLGIVQCVTGTCGSPCDGVLPEALPGLPGGP